MRRLAAALILALAAALPACGGDGDGSQSGARAPARAPAVVIRHWADTLRAGHVRQAASFFALPAVVENGTPPLRLTTRSQVVAFNTALPCGARLVRTFSSGRFTTAEFVLTERPGPGRCGTGTGQKARTTFVIRDGKIVEWRRVSEAPEPAGRVA